MQICAHEAENSQHARQQRHALQCCIDAEICRGVRAEKRNGAWMDEVLGCVQ